MEKERETTEEETENFTDWDIFDLDWPYKSVVLLGKDIPKYSDCILNAGMCLLMISLAGYYFVRLNKKRRSIINELHGWKTGIIDSFII